jgi:hypothetical protein
VLAERVHALVLVSPLGDLSSGTRTSSKVVPILPASTRRGVRAAAGPCPADGPGGGVAQKGVLVGRCGRGLGDRHRHRLGWALPGCRRHNLG